MEWLSAAWLAVGVFILLAYTLEAITGFGSIVIALSLSALLLPIEQLLPVLVPLNIGLTGYLAWRYRQAIDKALLLKLILPGMLLGTTAGYLVRPYLDENLLRQLLGILVLWFAGRELWRLRSAALASAHPLWLSRVLTLGGGLCHGLFASGGPLLVYALAGSTLDKTRFRATLVTVWFSLNSLLTLAFLADGRLSAALPHIALFAPLLLLGLWVGETLHHKVNERHFRIAVYWLLLVTALILLWPR